MVPDVAGGVQLPQRVREHLHQSKLLDKRVDCLLHRSLRLASCERVRARQHHRCLEVMHVVQLLRLHLLLTLTHSHVLEPEARRGVSLHLDRSRAIYRIPRRTADEVRRRVTLRAAAATPPRLGAPLSELHEPIRCRNVVIPGEQLA
eukprot:729701-Pleurochrysis_carterae.AAC.2